MTHREDGSGYELIDPAKYKSGVNWRKPAMIVVAFILGGLFGASIVQINHATQNEFKKMKLIERELKASSKLSGSDARDINIYHYQDGSLVASWYENGAQCTDVPLVEPSSSNELWRTEAIPEDSGKCTSPYRSSGIGN